MAEETTTEESQAAVGPTVIVDRRDAGAPQKDPTQANPTLVAITQLVTFVTAMVASVIIILSHALPPGANATLAMAIVIHGGIIGYNGATKGSSK